jgi:quercetin dioxygenase-like cupin family protein
MGDSASQGYVLRPRGGERFMQRGGEMFINVDPTRGSNALAVGTQQIPVGVGIPIHRHFEMDEAFYVLDGAGTFILNDVRHGIEKGASIFLPRTAWHGFENADRELNLLWVVTPPQFPGLIREIAAPPGFPAKTRTKEEMNEIGHRYGTEYR